MGVLKIKDGVVLLKITLLLVPLPLLQITTTRRTTNTIIITTIKKLSPTNEAYITQYYQCGGINHQGSTKCVLIISNVFYLNNYYSQCL